MNRCFLVIFLLYLATGSSYSLTKRELWVKDNSRIANLRVESRKEIPDSQRLVVLICLTESEKYSTP
jgi:hypothetical protein